MKNLAVCGLGQIGLLHLQNLQSLRGASVVGVFDKHTEVTHKVARDTGVKGFPSFAALLDDESLDAVVIATPSDSHAELALGALEAGKAVWLEKPLSATLSDGEKVVAASEAHPELPFQIGFCERFNPAFIEAYHALRRGAIGEVRAIYSSRVAPFYLGNPAWAGGVLDTAAHNFDLIRWFKGASPMEIRAVGARLYPEAPAFHTVTTTMRFGDDSLAVDSVTWLRDEGHPLGICARPRVSIFGERGVLEVDLTSRPASLLNAAGFQQLDTILLGGAGYCGALKAQFEAFLGSLDGQKSHAATPREALESEKIALAAAQSLRENREISLQEISPSPS